MADTWSDHNPQLWFCITGHWIAKEAASSSLQLKAALIAFIIFAVPMTARIWQRLPYNFWIEQLSRQM